MILAGDIGGTNTRLALINITCEGLQIVSEEIFPSRERTSLESAVEEFLFLHPCDVTEASFGIAGPVKHGRCDATNLPWVVDARNMAKLLHLKRIGLINDLVANAYGIEVLKNEDFVVLNKGVRNAIGNKAIISAGTGLGEAGMFWDGQAHRPFESEGGHTDFAPRNRLEMDLLDYSLNHYRRVSYERFLSGPGIFHIYCFLRDMGKSEEPPWLAEEIRLSDPAPIIAHYALNGKNHLCYEALELFIAIYGAEAGNLALKFMATGGVYLGGGIAPKIISKLREPVFMNAFTAKGRMEKLLREIPVKVIMNPKAALIGAAYMAMSGKEK